MHTCLLTVVCCCLPLVDRFSEIRFTCPFLTTNFSAIWDWRLYLLIQQPQPQPRKPSFWMMSFLIFCPFAMLPRWPGPPVSAMNGTICVTAMNCGNDFVVKLLECQPNNSHHPRIQWKYCILWATNNCGSFVPPWPTHLYRRAFDRFRMSSPCPVCGHWCSCWRLRLNEPVDVKWKKNLK